MIENLKKAWQGEGPEFQPLPPPRRRKREHFGVSLKIAMILVGALILFRAGLDLSSPFRAWWQFRALQRQLLGNDDSIRAEAASELAVQSKQAIPILLSASHDSRPEVREAALTALIKSPFGDDHVLPALTEALDDPDARLRVFAIHSLGQLARMTGKDDPKEGEKIIDALLLKFRSALKDTDPEVRAEAATALGGLGSRAKESVVDLSPLLNDQDPLVRETAARAIVQIDPTNNDAAVSVLVAALADSSPLLDSWPALDAVLKLGPDVASAAVPTLVKLLQDDDQFAHLHVFRALKEIGPKASEALPALKAYLDGSKARIRDRDMIPRQRRMPMMAQMQAQEDRQCVHYEAAMAAIAIEGKANPWVVSALVRIVTDSNEPFPIRSLAAREVRKADPLALADFLPKMIDQLVNEKNPQLRAQGFQFLMEIDPKAMRKAISSDPTPSPNQEP
jgi:HEAT repeat protein